MKNDRKIGGEFERMFWQADQELTSALSKKSELKTRGQAMEFCCNLFVYSTILVLASCVGMHLKELVLTTEDVR